MSKKYSGAGVLVCSYLDAINLELHILQYSRSVGMCPGTAVRGLQPVASAGAPAFSQTTVCVSQCRAYRTCGKMHVLSF